MLERETMVWNKRTAMMMFVRQVTRHLRPVREHMIDVRMTQCPIQRRVGGVAVQVMNPGNTNAQPTAEVADHHAREVDVRAKLPIVHLDGTDAGGDIEVSITRDGHEAILKEVVGPCLIAVDTCVDMMCVSIIRATTGARPIVGDEGQHGRQRYPQEGTVPVLPFTLREGHGPV